MTERFEEYPQPDFTQGVLARVDREMPPDLRGQFRSLVEDVQFHAIKRGWHPLRQYDVLADLVRNGWRGPEPSEEARRGL